MPGTKSLGIEAPTQNTSCLNSAELLCYYSMLGACFFGIETMDHSLMVSCLHCIESDWSSFMFFCGLHNVQVASIATENFRPLPTDASTNFALSPAVVRKAIATDVEAGLIPFFLCGTVLINLKAPHLSSAIF
jgi:hypothetical protein